MTPIPDTHTYIRRLTEAGFTEAQAEAQVTIWLDWIKADLATKGDVKDLSIEIRQEMKDLGVELRQEMKDLAVELRQEMKDLGVELRQEMKDLAVELRQEMEDLGVELRQEMKNLEIRLLKWTVTLLFLQAGLIVALIKLLPGPSG